jgi:flagellin
MSGVDVTRIAGNIGALQALNSMMYVNNQLAIHQNRLATGKRLNSAEDDPAGMSLATTFDIRRTNLKTVLNSIGDAKNLMSTMEGGLKKVQDILVKMSNKVLEAKGSTIGDTEKAAITSQLKAFAAEIDDIVSQTQWNGTNLISGQGGSGSSASLSFLTSPDASTAASSFSFAAGTKIAAGQGFKSGTATLSNTGLGLTDTQITISTAATQTAGSIAVRIDNALNAVKEGITQIGSFKARLSFKEDALSTQYINTEAAYNRIMNANMAEEQVEASKFTILQQTSVAMLAQANTAPQAVLSLFR